MVAPDKPSDRIQYIDARDLAAFVLRLVERKTVGTFNATSPPGMFTIGDVVSASITAANEMAKPNPPPSPVWVPADFLAQQKVQPWSDMPVWIPASGEYAGFADASVTRALREGLRSGPFSRPSTIRWRGIYSVRPRSARSWAPVSRPSARKRFSRRGARYQATGIEARLSDRGPRSPIGGSAAGGAAGTAGGVRDAVLHVLQLYHSAAHPRHHGHHLGIGKAALSILGHLYRHVGGAAGVRLVDLALSPHGFSALGLCLFHGQPAGLLSLVQSAAGSHLDRAQLLRLGERLQFLHRRGVLELDGGCVHARAGRAHVRVHRGGRQYRGTVGAPGCRTAGGTAGHHQSSAHFRGAARQLRLFS